MMAVSLESCRVRRCGVQLHDCAALELIGRHRSAPVMAVLVESRRMTAPGVSLAGALVRIALAVLLVVLTFNPSGYSLVHWLTAPPVAFTPGKALAGLLLIGCWVACLRTAFIALGKYGLLLGAATCAALVWVLVDQEWVSLAGPGLVWVSLLVVGLLLGIGLSWSLLRARATGQLEVQ